MFKLRELMRSNRKGTMQDMPPSLVIYKGIKCKESIFGQKEN